MPNTVLAYLTARGAELPAGEYYRLETISVSGGNRYAVKFDDTTAQQIIWTLPILPGIYQGGALTLTLECIAASATSGNVKVTAEVEAITPGDAVDLDGATSFDTANSQTTAVAGTAGYLFEVAVTLTNKDGAAAGDHLRLRVKRDAADGADTATGDLRVLGATLTEAVTTLDLTGFTTVSLPSTRANPDLFVTSDGSTGLYFYGNTIQPFGANITLDNLGNAGVGAMGFNWTGASPTAIIDIEPNNVGHMSIRIKAKSGQTADLIRCVNSSDATIAKVDASGNVTGTNLSGTNSGDVSLAGSYDYITISGQTVTRGQVDLTTDVTGTLPTANGGLGADNSAATGVPVFSAGAVTVTATTGSGNVVRAGSPTLTGYLEILHTAGLDPGWYWSPSASSYHNLSFAANGGWGNLNFGVSAGGSSQLSLGASAGQPGTGLDLRITANTDLGVRVTMAAGQTAAPVLVRDDSNVTVFTVTAAGAVTAASYNGVAVTNGGSGALTVTGTTSVSGTNSGDVSLAGSYDYITISGQTVTRGQVDLTTDVTGTLPAGNGGTGLSAVGSRGKVLASTGTVNQYEFPAGDLYTQTDPGSGTVTFDMANSRVQLTTLTGNRAIALTNDADGMRGTLIIQQDGSGGRTVTSWFGGNVTTWYGTAGPTTAPVLSTALNSYDAVSWLRLSSSSYLAWFSKGS
jgi:hypothetical protein